MTEATNHSHEMLRGHILPDYFAADIRENWRSSYYWEALGCHHTYSNDRPALLAAVGKLLQLLEAQTKGCHSADDKRFSILDIGCGTGEVSSAILAQLKSWPCVEYTGIDKDQQVLEDAHCRLKETANSNIQFSLHKINYNEKKWSDANVFKARYFKIAWMIHSGYYVEKNHVEFLKNIEQLTAANGLIILVHNPAGNIPFLTATQQIGLQDYRIKYKRQVCLPKLPEAVFSSLGSDTPITLEEYSQLHAEYPEARALRLLLEFYAPEYPLDLLLPNDRRVYVENWRNHLQKNDWTFSNDHELLLLLPRHHDISFRKNLESILTEGFTYDNGREIFRHNR